MTLPVDRTALDRLDDFVRAGVEVPHYDVRRAAAATSAAPRWVHLGAGNLFRSLHAVIAQNLLDRGIDAGIVLLNTHHADPIRVYQRHDNLFLNVVMSADGAIHPELIGSVAESHYLCGPTPQAWQRAREIFRSPSLQLVTLTITEKGYALAPADVAGPTEPRHTMTIAAALLLERYRAGAAPIALVSSDNFSENGARAAATIATVARAWHQAGLVDHGFVDYVTDESRVAFPWTMVDRITPVPSGKVAEQLRAIGIAAPDLEPAARPGGGPLAVFSTTEEVHYLVVEDSFPNGRPALDRGGVLLADRDTVNKADRMKVTACLNPLHTAMAVYGCLLGYPSIAAESADPDIAALIRGIGYTEGLPYVADPGIISPRGFLDEVVERRIPNPGIPDTPQRIATDTSQKVAVRFGVTISCYAAEGRGPALTYIPLAIAGWIRYLLALDDNGEPFTLSPDPLADRLHGLVAGIRLGEPAGVGDRLRPLLSDPDIFGLDLYRAGVGETIEAYVRELVAGPGAVRATLHKER